MRAFVVMLIVLAVPAGAAHRHQERQIKARLEQFAQVWATNDPQKLAAFHSLHGDLINPAGRWARGRMEIEKLYTDEHGTLMKGSRLQVAEVQIRFLDDGLAFVDCSATIEATKGPDGAERPPLPLHLALLTRRQDDRWMFVSVRPYAFLPAAR